MTLTGPMRADAFLDWAAAQASGRFELIDGYVTPLGHPPARVARALGDASGAFAAALRRGQVEGRVFPGGAPVLVDSATVLQPDLVVGVGGSLGRAGVTTDAPVIVIEGRWPGRSPLSEAKRAARYLAAPGVAHVVVVDPDARAAVWRRRDAAGRALTSERRAGTLRFDPPGLEVLAEDLFITG